jgi:DNA repair exonuclease SbcCD ATPase subunit
MGKQFQLDLEMEADRLIDISYTLYGEMEQIYERLSSNQLADTISTLALMQHLENLRKKVQRVDSNISDFLQSQRPRSEELQQKISLRDSRIRKLLQMNKELTEKASRHRSMVKGELATMQKGHAAMQGYKTTSKQGKRISTVS